MVLEVAALAGLGRRRQDLAEIPSHALGFGVGIVVFVRRIVWCRCKNV